MASQAPNGPRWRNSPFGRGNASPSPGPPPGHARSKSSTITSPLSPPIGGHSRNQSLAADFGLGSLNRTASKRSSVRAGSPGTFAPKFIHTEAVDGAAEKVGGIEGENDFSGKRYVWLRDSETAFVRGWVIEELGGGMLRVQCDDGSVSTQEKSNEPPD